VQIGKELEILGRVCRKRSRVEHLRLLRGSATRRLALVLDPFVREAMHQHLQIGVEFLRFAQVILRFPQEQAHFGTRPRRHAESKRSSHRGPLNSGEFRMAQAAV
jgi:hypothetical protein